MSQELTETENGLIQWLQQRNWVKPGQFVHCTKAETNNFEVSKFGGKIPHLPNEEIPTCQECGQKMEVVAQIYVPSLPDFAKNVFPEALKQSLIVLFVCTEDLPFGDWQMVSRVYSQDQIKNLIYDEPKEDAKIESALFQNYEMLDTYNDTSNDYLEVMGEVDDLAMEELMRKVRDEIRTSKCYFGGFPYYQQGEETPGDNFTLLLNIENDENFSMMWGDGGNAQIWVNNENPEEFHLTWQCG